MTTKETKNKIKEAGGDWDIFVDWMFGQTVGVSEDGETNWYDHDVDRFIRYKCEPKNEPVEEWD